MKNYMDKQRAVKLFKQHLTYAEISRILDISLQRVRVVVEQEIGRDEINKIVKERALFRLATDMVKRLPDLTEKDLINAFKEIKK